MNQRFFLIFILTACSTLTAKEKEITIFVHGTIGLHDESIKTLPTLFNNNISQSRYKKRIIERRKKPSTYYNQATQEMGLKKINMIGEPNSGAEMFARLYDQLQRTCYPETKSIGYYTFGWSGVLNSAERYTEAQFFYKALRELVNQLRPLHPDFKIKILTYSHGANVALNLAEIHENHTNPANFVVDELIMFGAPVQRETDCFVASPFFVKAYNLYSRKDCIQKMDCFSSIRFFSDRRFKDSSRCIIGTKLQQIDIKLTIAANKDTLHNYKSKKRINKSPGHIELWYFGWTGTSSWYRKNFPLYPIPTAVFAPCLIHLAQTHMPDTKSIAIELQPDLGTARLRKRYRHKKITVPFMPPSEIKTMQKQAIELKKHLTPAA